MEVFLAYPYALDKERDYRERLQRGVAGSDVTLAFADEHLSNKHVLEKIRDMMEDADLLVFDLTGGNPNVTLELGIAIHANFPYVVAIRKSAVSDLNSDIHGWDQLRYVDEEDLAAVLIDRLSRGRVPKKTARSEQALPLWLKLISFGLRTGAVSENRAEIGIAVLPLTRNPIELGGLLDEPLRMNRDFANIVNAIANQQQARHFWPSGFTPKVNEDHLQISAHNDDEGMRVYRNGAVTYYRSLVATEPVCLRPATLEEFCRLSMMIAREIYRYFNVSVRRIGLQVTLAPTQLFLIDQARPDFIPEGYRGDPLVEGTQRVLHIPTSPATVEVSTGDEGIIAASRDVQRILTARAQHYRYD